ncbi:MAG: polyphosphate polymerase domain-containing protein [Solobacterium sp.]|nr:polyphosphate polymerase domain-containing protein [Solobacterium sp.]
MKNEQVFARVEQKYGLSEAQAAAFLELAGPCLKPDARPEYTLRNIYLDSPDDRMIIRSLDKPVYKEKLRLRAYGKPGMAGPLFLEMKKKSNGIVFKRRITLEADEIPDCLRGAGLKEKGQIGRELDYMFTKYRPVPKAYIAYDRQAWSGTFNPDLRVTMDRRIRYRLDDLDINSKSPEELLAMDSEVILEIKFQDAYPLWLAEILNHLRLQKTSFSKYGRVYRITHTAALSGLIRQEKTEESKCLHPYLPGHHPDFSYYPY